MLKEEIVVGKSYVNEGACIIREVVEEVDSYHIRYNTFELDSGRLLPARHRVCSKGELKRWADREARANEASRVHPYEQAAWTDPLPSAGRGSLRPEEARSAAEASPGSRTFPQPK